MIGAFVVGLSFVTSFIFLGAKSVEDKQSQIQSTNAEAKQAYARGKLILENRSVEDREQKAIDEFNRAVTLDPTFALAHVGLAQGFTSIAGKLSYDKSRDYYAKARVSAQKALILDPNLPEGYSISGWLKYHADWDFEAAEIDLRKAVSLMPDNAQVHFRLSRVLMALGKSDEALAEILKAYEIDPVAEMTMSGRFAILESRGEYDEALRLAEGFLRENKDNAFAGRVYGTFLYHNNDFPQVIEIGERALEKKGRQNAYAWLSLVSASYYRTGDFEKAGELLNQLEVLSQEDTKALYSLAINYAEIGRHDEAFIALQKCFEQQEERMIWIKGEPRFANLRNDSRYQEILQKMKL